VIALPPERSIPPKVQLRHALCLRGYLKGSFFVVRYGAFDVLSSVQWPGSPVLTDNPEFHPLRNLAKRSVQCVRDRPKTTDRGVNDPPFDPTDVRPIEAAIGAEAFLRETGLIAEFAHHGANGFCLQIGRLDLPLAPLHGQIRWW